MSSARRGGVDEVVLCSQGATDPRQRAGSGTPEGVVVGNPGDVFFRVDGGSGQAMYVKETGVGTNTGWVALGQGGTKRLFFAPSAQSPQTSGQHVGLSITADGAGNLEFAIPNDFNSLVSLVVLLIPANTIGAADIDLESDYAAVGQDAQAHSEANAVITYALVADQIAGIDVSSVFSAIAAGDVCGLELDFTSVTGGAVVLGTILEYR